MKQVGHVIKEEGSLIAVKITRHAACDKCGACGASGPKEQTLEAKNDIGAKIGDNVVVEIPNRKFYSAVMIIYLIPLIALLLGVWLGSVYDMGLGSSVAGAIFGFGFLVITFILVALYDKRIAKDPAYAPKVTGFSTESDLMCASDLAKQE